MFFNPSVISKRFVKRKAYIILFISCLLVGLIITCKTVVQIQSPGGGMAKLSSPSLPISWFDSKSIFRYRNSQNIEGKIKLVQNFFRWPVLIIPSEEKDVYLCLFYNDVDVQVLRFDTAKAFVNPPLKIQISRLVIDSTCSFDEATDQEWLYMFSRLKNMSKKEFKRFSIPDLQLGPFGFYNNPEYWLVSLEWANHVQYDGDVVHADPKHPGTYVRRTIE